MPLASKPHPKEKEGGMGLARVHEKSLWKQIHLPFSHMRHFWADRNAERKRGSLAWSAFEQKLSAKQACSFAYAEQAIMSRARRFTCRIKADSIVPDLDLEYVCFH